MNILKYLIFVLFMMNIHPTEAQMTDNRYINQISIGGFVSVAFPVYILDEGTNYHPILLGGYFHLPLYKTHKNFNIAVDILPQVGIIPFDNFNAYEFGLNISFAFSFAISEHDVLSVNLGSGPHYISATVERQAPGFIFSDNLNFTFRHRFKVIETGITAGVRHISNAGLEEPNQGLENIIIGFTIARPFN